ncbi:MAG: hypothetical protein QY322_04025 [bacterium]|nr:MAG: hypothetical protein QY322_04025 [bacterium]
MQIMKDFAVKRTEQLLVDKFRGNETFKEGLRFYSVITEEEMRDVVAPIVTAAKKIAPAVCQLDKSPEKRGFMLGITKNIVSFPMVFIEVGHVWAKDFNFGTDGKRAKYVEFAQKKARVIRLNPGFISSGQNLNKTPGERLLSDTGIDIPDGALLFGDWIISVSAFKNAKLDTAASLSIATGANLVDIDAAIRIAKSPDVNCQIFLDNLDKIYTEPILH